MLHGFEQNQRETLVGVKSRKHEYVGCVEERLLVGSILTSIVIHKVKNYPPVLIISSMSLANFASKACNVNCALNLR